MKFRDAKSDPPEIGKRVLVEVLERFKYGGERWRLDVGTYDGRGNWTVAGDLLAIVRRWSDLPAPGPYSHPGDRS